jgi:hypothetical protein
MTNENNRVLNKLEFIDLQRKLHLPASQAIKISEGILSVVRYMHVCLI